MATPGAQSVHELQACEPESPPASAVSEGMLAPVWSPVSSHVQEARAANRVSFAPKEWGQAEKEVGLCAVDATLSELLEEKRRLLRRVSAKLGEQVVSTVLASANTATSPLPSCCGSGSGAGAVVPGLTVTPGMAEGLPASDESCAWSPTQSLSTERLAMREAVPGAMTTSPPEVYEETKGDGCCDLRSLCTSLRDSIGRKRLLLDQLQHI